MWIFVCFYLVVVVCLFGDFLASHFHILFDWEINSEA